MIKSKATDRGARVKVTFVLPADGHGDGQVSDALVSVVELRQENTR